MWFQPLLLLAGAAMFVPAAVRRTPPEWLVPVLGMLAALGVVSLVAWLVGRRLQSGVRTAVGWLLVAFAGLALLVLTALSLPDQPEHALPFAAAVAVTVSPARSARLRLPFQAVLLLGMAALLIAAGRPLVEVAFAIFLLVFVVWLTGVLAQSFLSIRQDRLAARTAAQRRAELLTAVRDLSARSSVEAARTAVDSLRSLGFSVAAVSVERAGMLVPLAREGIAPAPEIAVGDGLSGAAVEQDRVQVSTDYARDPRALPGREGLGAAIAVPIRASGRAVGVVLGGRQEPGRLPDAVVEVAEVLAGHLGGVLETEERLDRQRELLERMQALDVMRERLITEVSEEVRDPLTVVRGIAETLVAHGDRLREEQRVRLLGGFVEQTRSLRTTIDALLDFSRLQAARPLPTLGLTRLGDVVEGSLGGVPVGGDLDVLVRTDPVLLGRALETVRTVSAIRELLVTDGPDEVVLRLALSSTTTAPKSRLLLGLAERLVVTIGGSWSRGAEVVEIRLPREAEGVGEDTP